MKKSTPTLGLMAMLLTFLLCISPAFAASNVELEERIEKLEKQAGSSEEAPLGQISEWVTLSGLIEVEVGFESSDLNDSDDSDITLATVELGIEAKPVDWVTGSLLLLYEEDETDLDVDEGYITLGASDTIPYYLSAGKFYVPFGVFETMMISDPITLDLAETNETAVQVGIEMNGFRGAVYAFNGDSDEADNNDNSIESFGLSAGYILETDAFTLGLGADWISNILDSDTLGDVYDDKSWATTLDDQVPGFAVNAMAIFGPFSLIGEYVAMTDDAEAVGGGILAEEISAYAIEAGFTFDVSGFETTIAIGYQASDDATDILPESKIIGAVGVGITDNLSLAVEYAYAENNDVADGGDGDEIDTVTVQLAFEF